MKRQVKKNIICLIVIGMFASGCNIRQPVIEETGYYKINPASDIYSIASISMAEIDNRTNYISVCEPLSRTLYSTFVKKHLFEVKYLDRESDLWQQVGALGLSADREALKRYRDIVGSDALMVGCLTEYKPFPSTLIGLNLKIYDLRTGQLVWVLEQVWDSNDKGVENRIQRYFEKNVKSGYEPMDWEYVRTSPSAYRQFVCFEIVSTLPSRNFYNKDYVDYSKASSSIKDEMLRPILRFPSQAEQVIGLK